MAAPIKVTKQRQRNSSIFWSSWQFREGKDNGFVIPESLLLLGFPAGWRASTKSTYQSGFLLPRAIVSYWKSWWVLKVSSTILTPKQSDKSIGWHHVTWLISCIERKHIDVPWDIQTFQKLWCPFKHAIRRQITTQRDNAQFYKNGTFNLLKRFQKYIRIKSQSRLYRKITDHLQLSRTTRVFVLISSVTYLPAICFTIHMLYFYVRHHGKVQRY